MNVKQQTAVEAKFQKYVVHLYETAKQLEEVGYPDILFLITLVEDKWLNGNGTYKPGSKIIYDLEGMEANLIRFPQVYMKYLDTNSPQRQYDESKAVEVLFKLIRKLDEIEKTVKQFL